MSNNYICNVCGSEYDNLDGYLACVTKCVETKKNDEKVKKVNAYLNEIKKTENHLSEVKDNFKKEYPDEFYLNFGTQEDTCKCDDECNDCDRDCHCESSAVSKESKPSKENNLSTMELSYMDNGKDKPTLSAKVNGKKVEYDAINKLFVDPDTRYIAKMLGII